jgi:hypothetical protein
MQRNLAEINKYIRRTYTVLKNDICSYKYESVVIIVIVMLTYSWTKFIGAPLSIMYALYANVV